MARKPQAKKPRRRQRSKPRAFVMAPFDAHKRRELNRRGEMYEDLRRMASALTRKGAGEINFQQVLEKMGLGQRKRYGFLFNTLKLPELFPDRRFGEFARILHAFTATSDPLASRRAKIESLQLIRQLKSLGFKMHIQDPGEADREMFVRAARKAGASVVQVPSRMKIPGTGTFWARDQYVKLGNEKVRPKTDPHHLLENVITGNQHFFGEGGTMVQIGPKTFAIHKRKLKDPRLKQYEKKGYVFHPMPDSFLFDQPLSDLFGFRIFTINDHIDFVMGGIPERSIVGVDPRYYAESRMSFHFMEQNYGTKLVTVPIEEADRHPASFLPLGGGRALVDSGAPGFIEALREAGAKPIPTVVPLDNLLQLKGSLHCLFNEH